MLSPAAQSTVPLPLASTLAGHGPCSFPLALITRPGSTESPLHSEWKCGVVGQEVNRSAVGSSRWPKTIIGWSARKTRLGT